MVSTLIFMNFGRTSGLLFRPELACGELVESVEGLQTDKRFFGKMRKYGRRNFEKN